MFVSVFNDVLGPVMRGPSSSHTAGSYHIGRVTRDLLGGEPARVRCSFNHGSSLAQTYVQQGADNGFVTGLMGWDQIDPIFCNAIDEARKRGVEADFEVVPIPHADHPNFVRIDAESADGDSIRIEAKSIGGGTFRITRVDGFAVEIDGKTHETLVRVDRAHADRICALAPAALARRSEAGGECLVQLSTPEPVDSTLFTGVRSIRCARPVYYTQQADPPFTSGAEMVEFAEANGYSLGEAVLEYEKAVLGLTTDEALSEMLRRYEVMRNCVAAGLQDDSVDMLLLRPVAGSVMEKIKSNRVPLSGPSAIAAAAALAAMHTCNSRGIICAAPTGASAGVIAGLVTMLGDEFEVRPRDMALILFAAGGIGLITAMRATFAAEEAGCQVEIGAAGAMASAGVVEFGGGSAKQACDAAAIAFQNTMGSVCDLVQGICEIPCHTRNAVAASSALINANLILGGYPNPIPLDETVDVVHDVGKKLPCELRCTAKGGLALAPSALSLRKLK